GVSNPYIYLLLWGGGLIVWGAVFWGLRKRAGPVLFIERQIAHVWAAAVAATIGVFILEIAMGMPVLSLAPMLAVIAGMTFVVKAGMLSGWFYVWAAAEFFIALPMALYPDYGILLFGAVTAVSFFIPGLHYYRQRLRSRQAQMEAADDQGRRSSFPPDAAVSRCRLRPPPRLRRALLTCVPARPGARRARLPHQPEGERGGRAVQPRGELRLLGGGWCG